MTTTTDATMTILTNDFHGTEYRTRKTAAEIERIAAKYDDERTPAERAWARKVRSALCGMSGCVCGDSLGRRARHGE